MNDRQGMIELRNELNCLTREKIKEISEINRKYNFSHSGRSKEDQKRSRKLWDDVHRLTKQFDEEHPLSPCPECGKKRLVSCGGSCMNIDHCSRAKPLGG